MGFFNRPQLQQALWGDIRHVWGMLVGGAFAWGFAFLLADTLEDQVRFASGLLQVMGVCTVAKGLYDTRRLFKPERPGLLKGLRAWLGLLWAGIYRPTTRVTAAKKLSAEVLGSASVSVKLQSGMKMGDNVEAQLKTLRNDVFKLQERVSGIEQGYSQQIGDLEARQEEEQAARQSADDALSRRLEALGIGGLTLEVVGLVWVLAGIALSTWATEVASFLTR